jgi:hypothetical protein
LQEPNGYLADVALRIAGRVPVETSAQYGDPTSFALRPERGAYPGATRWIGRGHAPALLVGPAAATPRIASGATAGA